MVDEKFIISQCIDLANQVMKNGLNAIIKIEMGDNIKFEFNNKEDKVKTVQLKRKSPSQEARNNERSKKYKESLIKNEAIEKVKEETEDEIKPEGDNFIKEEEIEITIENSCGKVFVIPKYDREKTNEAIEQDIICKFEKAGIIIRKIFVQREGHPLRGKYDRSIIMIEPLLKQKIWKEEIKIENCWILIE